MAYTKQNFKAGDILHAAQLNAMDEQIALNAANSGTASSYGLDKIIPFVLGVGYDEYTITAGGIETDLHRFTT